MLLSIITINRNNLEGLRKTFDSVKTQTSVDFEYIVVDGASMDGSLELIEQLSNLIVQPFTWISEPDTGVYQAMNKGIKIAKGKYLLFLNSGDFLVNEHVLSQVFLTEHVADILCGRCCISKQGHVIHVTQPPLKISFGYLYEAGLAHQSTFIKRDLFYRYGLYREDFKYNADIEFWYRTIILQYCSTETLNTIITDYNTDGISSLENQSIVYKQEMSEIYSHPLLQLFIPDYNLWIAERQKMDILYWVKSKKSLYNVLVKLYAFAAWLTKK
jgi:glycosyltransferase involved in cell wall biosynthesis